jgi:hypothetical protein
VRVNDTISTFFGFDNVSGCEIKVKANKHKEIIIVITNEQLISERFVFTDNDRDSLDRFEIMMTNVFSTYVTFAKNYGVKQNMSTKAVDCSIGDENAKLSVAAIPGVGVHLRIENEQSGRCATFLFTNEDQDIFSRFKTEFKRLVNNISHIKLPNQQNSEDTKDV